MNWASIGEAAIGGLQSLASSLVSSGMGYEQSRKLMKYQQELNQQSIDAQNVFNSPAEQMKRLEKAGLNKNLVYGSGVDGNQSSAANTNIANRNPAFDVDVMSSYFRSRQLENETNLAEANRRQILQNTALSEAKTLRELREIKKFDATFDDVVKQASANLMHTLQSVEESKQRVNESVQRTSNLKSEANKLNEEIKYWEAHAENEKNGVAELLKQRAYEAQTRGDLNTEQQAVARSIVSLNTAKVAELVSLIRKIDLEAGNEAIEYEINKAMQGVGMGSVKPKDLIMLLKDLLITFMKNK